MLEFQKKKIDIYSLVKNYCALNEGGSPLIRLYLFVLFWHFADRASQYIYLSINQLDALNFIMSLFHALHVSSTCVHRLEVKIVLYSIWYHHTYRWPSRAQVHGTATYSCDDTRCCILQFWPPADEHMCSKHVKAWNKLIVKFSASSWLILR